MFLSKFEQTRTMKKVIMIIFVMSLIISVVAAAVPYPHAFSGKIISKDGSLTNAKTIVAKLNGAVTGKATIEGDEYKITVIDNIGSGGTIEFFIGDEKSSEPKSVNFKAFEVTKINLTFDTIPDETIGSCGDGICAVEECSFCAIDCPVSKCNNNNVCDSAIGEDLITAESDCSVCGDGYCTGNENSVSCPNDCATTTSTTTKSSGGGGGGGSTSTKSTVNTSVSTDNTSTVKSSPITMSIDELNDDINKSIEEIGGNKITGFAVFNLKDNGTAKIVLFLIIIFFIYYYFLRNLFTKRKKKKKEIWHKSKIKLRPSKKK